MDTIDLQILLNGVDITDHCDLGNNPVETVSALNEELDTCTLVVKRGDALNIKGWQELVIKNGSEVIWGGYLLTPNRKPSDNQVLNDYPITGSDYAAYLEKVFVQATYENKTDAEIIAEVFAASSDLAGFDASTFVTSIRTIPRVVFNRVSVREVLTWLAEQTGGFWYVDYDKKVHYWAGEEFHAPFDVTNDPTDTTKKTVEDVTVDVDAVGVVNLVEVIGGNALGGDATFAFTQSGLSPILRMNKRLAPWEGQTKIAVRRNEGGATTNLLVNPSFESNISDGWTQLQSGSGAAWAQDATKYYSGTKSLKITAGTALSMLHSATITLSPGESLTAQVMTWCNALAKSTLAIYDTAGAVVLASLDNRKTSAWERLTATYTNTGAANMTVRVELRNNGTDGTQVVYFDAVQAEKLAYPTAYCDGSLGTGYSWSGTAHNSTSSRVNMPVWVTLTVKVGNSEELTARNEVLYYDSEGKLEQETNWPTISNGIEVDGQEETPVRVTVRNYASHDFYGIWLKTVIVDEGIVDTQVARMRGAAELAKSAYESEVAHYSVRVPGLRAGQVQNVYLPQRGLDGDFLIQRVTTTIGIGGQIISTVDLGASDPGLIDLLLKLKRKTSGGGFDLSADEVMDQILDFSDEFTISEDEAVITSSEGPYLYDVAKYDYSKFAAE